MGRTYWERISEKGFLLSLRIERYMSEKGWFERRFDEHLLARDLVLVACLVLAFAVPVALVLGRSWQRALASGVLFAVLYLTAMELWSRWEGTSMFRYFFGGDPFRDTGIE